MIAVVKGTDTMICAAISVPAPRSRPKRARTMAWAMDSTVFGTRKGTISSAARPSRTARRADTRTSAPPRPSAALRMPTGCATRKLVTKPAWNLVLAASERYHSNVKPDSGKAISRDALNENTARTAMGR